MIMNKAIIACLLLGLSSISSNLLAQVDNVILITLDGLRPEEVFGGADERLMIPDLGVKKPKDYKSRYGADSPEERRKKLMPFLWDKIGRKKGWIAGDMLSDSKCLVTNGKYFSYPGYNEILTGAADEKINSNAKRYNKNTTVLEFLNEQPELIGTVSAFCSWDVFPFIINDQRSGVVVNAGWTKLTVGVPQQIELLNHAAENIAHEWDNVRYDVFTAEGAIECMRTDSPRVLYVALGETDDWAHAGRYDRYLDAARQNDHFIRRLWLETQSIKEYRNKTAFLITTDHGRGDGREGWKSHSKDLPGSESIWMAAFGAGITSKGIDEGGRFTQSQIASTVAALLGYEFSSEVIDTSLEIAKPLPICDLP
ncbi:MAG: hypothetical protein AAF483_26670 [Planctomycetota bacterium]